MGSRSGSFLGAAGLAALALVLVARGVAAGDERVRNGSFAEWEGVAPAGWSLEMGARHEVAGETSVVRRGPDGGAVLEGGAKTGVWQALVQPFPAKARQGYLLRFEARAVGLQLDPGQRENCYVGLAALKGGARRFLGVAPVRAGGLARGEAWMTMPPGFDGAEVWVFLSQTGRLEVRSVSVDEVADPFAILVEDMARFYSYFEVRGVEWRGLAERFRARGEAARDAKAFIPVAREMLAELRDPHVFIDGPGGERLETFRPEVRPNCDLRAVAGRLQGPRTIGKVALAGRTPEGYGYVAVASLAGEDALFAEVEAEIERLLDAPGLIVDLRANTGGDERRAQRIAAIFADRERVYARSRVRTATGDFVEGSPRTIRPREGKTTYARPIVCLIGPACMSSGEGFAKMMRVLPHVALVGQPTRGASGNPLAVELPNGVKVHYSRWVDLLPDGTLTEGKGLAPEILVPHEGPGDPTFEAAGRVLAERVAAAAEGGR